MLEHSRPQSHDPSDLRQRLSALAGPDFLSMCSVFVCYSQPISFARFDAKSVNRGLPVLDKARALDPCRRSEGLWLWGWEWCLSSSVIKCGANGKKCKLSKTELIWPKSRLQISKMSTKCNFGAKLNRLQTCCSCWHQVVLETCIKIYYKIRGLSI